MRIILGSSSVGRRKVMEELGYTFEIMKPDIDEKSIRDDDPAEMTLKIARAKAFTLLDELRGELVDDMDESSDTTILITSDQVVVCNGVVREKPVDQSAARAYLASYAAHPAQTVTSLVVVNVQTGQSSEGTDIATQYFHPIPDSIVDELLAKGDILHCAGAFMVDDPILEPYIGRREGTRESIIGLPPDLLKKLIAEATA